jgi:hypothetical protein
MKRVRALAAIPAVVGLALPFAAQPPAGAATTPTRPAKGAKAVSGIPLAPRNSGKKCAKYVCISVIGTRLYTTTVHEWINHRNQFRRDRAEVFIIPQFAQYGLWLSRSESWSGTKEFTWHPDCSWTSSTNLASAVAQYTAGQPRVNIFGEAYQGKPYCHYI